uniref:protocadherin-16-like n=1 Tax=Myxine glutinosa TaxID=7769 RepID=UPI00358E9B36
MPTQWMPSTVLIATWLIPLVSGIDLQVEENQPPGTLVGNIFSVLPIDFGSLLYVLPVDGSPNDRDELLVDLTSGEIRTARQLDREKRYLIELLAVATSGRSMKVHVVVSDINDHTPSFPTDAALLTVPEGAPVGSRLVLPAAQDPDAGKFGLQGYSIRSANPPGGFFSLEWAASGGRAENPPELVLQRQLDRETAGVHLLELEAYDGGLPPRRGVFSVEIDVLDANDNHPTFSQPHYEAWVAEGSLPGTSVIQVFATDPDDGKNGEIHYSINRRVGDQEACFEVDGETGVVRLHRRLDFEFKHQHEILIEARDGAPEPEVSSAILTVHVRNTNDHPPTISLLFLGRGGQPAISEAAQPGDLVARVSVSDPDKAKNFGNQNGNEDGYMEEMAAITEEIPVSVSGPDSDRKTETIGSQPRVWLTGGEDRFGLRATEDGAIYLVVVSAVLDREVQSSYDMTVWAEDGGSPPLQNSRQFILFVEDQNDNPPLWNQKVYRAIVPENAPVGTLVLSVEARDADVGENGKLSYQLLYEGADDGTLGDSSKVKHSTDSHWSDGRHNSSGFSLINGHYHKPSEAGIFDLYTEMRNVSPGDKSPPMVDWFSIDPGSGVIRTAARLDHQLAIRVRLRAIAVDGGHPKLSASVPVIISVEDSGSEIVAVTRYNVTIREGTPPGSCFLQVYAADSGIKESQHVQFQMRPDVNGQSPSAQFSVHLSTGEVCLAHALPRDRGRNTYTFSVRLEHKDDLLSLAHIEVDVEETNDHHPVFIPVTYKLHMTAPGRTGLVLTQLSATDADGGHLGHVTYSLVQGENNVGPFMLDPESGVLSLASPLPSDSPPTLQLLANAHDGGGLSAETLAHISIVLRGKSDSRASPSDPSGGVVFANLPYRFSVSVDVPAGTLVGTVSASGSLGETLFFTTEVCPFHLPSNKIACTLMTVNIRLKDHQ